MKVASLLNGVDVDHLMEIIEAVRSTPELAKFRFHARNRWIEGTHNRTSIQGFYGVGMEDTSRTKPVQVNNDGPPVLLGENRGADPVEFIFHALAGSMTTTFVANAAAQGVKIDSIETELERDVPRHVRRPKEEDRRAPGAGPSAVARLRRDLESNADPGDLGGVGTTPPSFPSGQGGAFRGECAKRSQKPLCARSRAE
jgi:hypothetical protein